MPSTKEIEIKNYVTHHVRDLPDGHEIIIVSGELHKEKLLKLKCHWKNKEKEMLRTLNAKIFLQDPLKHLNQDEYDAGDGMNEEYVIECKFRNMPSTLYGDCFLEKLKYDRLMEKSKINGRKAAYVAA